MIIKAFSITVILLSSFLKKDAKNIFFYGCKQIRNFIFDFEMEK